jgi:hypothetical protein
MLLAATSLMLRVLGFRGARRLIEWSSRSARRFPLAEREGHIGPSREPERQQAEETVRLVESVARAGGFSCLPRSLTAWWLLRRQGIESALRIGVRKTEDRFQAHAWLEVEGLPLRDGKLSFAPFEPDMMARESCSMRCSENGVSREPQIAGAGREGGKEKPA